VQLSFFVVVKFWYLKELSNEANWPITNLTLSKMLPFWPRFLTHFEIWPLNRSIHFERLRRRALRYVCSTTIERFSYRAAFQRWRSFWSGNISLSRSNGRNRPDRILDSRFRRYGISLWPRRRKASEIQTLWIGGSLRGRHCVDSLPSFPPG